MKTLASITFLCEHTAELKPGLFGRGKARIERIEKYADRNCLSCAIKNAEKLVNRFTDSKGQPISQEAKKQSLYARIIRLQVSYNRTINRVESTL